jgi:hypothetical protein
MLIFAHPGHELRAFHLMELVRPWVFVLTDGSGSTADSRIGESRALVARAGAREAATFGPLTDREAYAALMASDAEPFLAHLEGLTRSLLDERVRGVLVDAAEGYNPVHDLCHWIGRAAAARARQRGAEISLYEVDLVSHPDPPGEGLRLRPEAGRRVPIPRLESGGGGGIRPLRAGRVSRGVSPTGPRWTCASGVMDSLLRGSRRDACAHGALRLGAPVPIAREAHHRAASGISAVA